jgi:phosphoglucomutase
MSLYEGLQELFGKYGFSLEGITSFTLAGKEGVEKIKYTMNKLREDKTFEFGNIKAIAIRDYLNSVRFLVKDGKIQVLELPESDVLYYEIDKNSWFCIRPSGTEPKIKIYYGVSEKSLELSEIKLKELQDDVLSVVKKLLY